MRIRKAGLHVLVPRISLPIVMALAYLAILNGLYFGIYYQLSWSPTLTGLAFAGGIFIVGATWLVALTRGKTGAIREQDRRGVPLPDRRKGNCIDPGAWPQYLLLLGVPVGASVISSGITSSKVAAGSLQKTERFPTFSSP